MAKSEILMWVAGIMMMIILGLAVGPTVTKSGDTARIAVINSEINTIRSTANLWLAQNSSTGDYTGLTSTLLQPYIPGMALGPNAKLQSKTLSTILYDIVPGATKTDIQITVSGLTEIAGAETSVKTSQSSNASSTTDNDTSDGILVFVYNG